MNGRDFYEELKDALVFVGLSWREKGLAKIQIDDNSLSISYKHRKIQIHLEEGDGTKQWE